MADQRAVCQLCSWFGKSGPGRAWAVWHWTFADGTSQLLCERHKTQASRAGGFGEPLTDKPGLVFVPTSIDPEVAAASRPRTLLEQVREEWRREMREELREYMSKVVVQVQFEDQNSTSGVNGNAKKTQARRRRAS